MPTPVVATREQIYAALYALTTAATFSQPIAGYTTWNSYAQKYVESPPAGQQPFMAQFEGFAERAEYKGRRLPYIRHLGVRLWCWARTDSGDPTERGAQYLNWMTEGIEEALMPDNMLVDHLTLGGLVEWCRIEGTIIRVPGDTDQQALVIIPVMILWPN
jgi:hypothetical protein